MNFAFDAVTGRANFEATEFASRHREASAGENASCSSVSAERNPTFDCEFCEKIVRSEKAKRQ
jgi:hypothetical protein